MDKNYKNHEKNHEIGHEGHLHIYLPPKNKLHTMGAVTTSLIPEEPRLSIACIRLIGLSEWFK